MIRAPAIPRRNRTAITKDALSAKNISKDTKPNRVNPVSKAFLRPHLSARLLIGIIKPAKMSEYISTIHNC